MPSGDIASLSFPQEFNHKRELSQSELKTLLLIVDEMKDVIVRNRESGKNVQLVIASASFTHFLSTMVTLESRLRSFGLREKVAFCKL